MSKNNKPKENTMKIKAGRYKLVPGKRINIGKYGQYTYKFFSDVYGTWSGEVDSLSGGFDIEEYDKGRIRLFDDAEITIIDDGFKIETSLGYEVLRVAFKAPLEEIKMNSYVDHFELNGFEGILRFQKKVYVNDNMFLNNIWYLLDIPEKLIVKGSCTIYNCLSLEVIPEKWNIYGIADFSYNQCLHDVKCKHFKDLDLKGCDALTSLPNGLTVKGSLDLTDCTSLTSLPQNLKVGGDLDLSGSGVMDIPQTIQVCGYIIRRY